MPGGYQQRQVGPAAPVQVVFKGQGQQLVINNSLITPAMLGPETLDPASTSVAILNPASGIAFDGKEDVWAKTLAGTATLQTVPTGTSAQLPVSDFVSLQPFGPVTTPAAQATQLGPFPVSVYRSVFLIVRNVTGLLHAALQFQADPAGQQLLSGPKWDLNSSSNLLVRAPILGPYVSVQLQELSGSAPVTVSMVLAGSSGGPVEQLEYPNQSGTTTWTGQAIPAASSQAFQLGGGVRRGVIYGFITPADATASLDFQLVTINAAGAVQSVYDELGKPAATIRYTAAAPDGTFLPALLVTNSDAGAAHSFTGAATIIPAS